MAKQRYSRLDSGLYVPGNDSLTVPKPDIPRPWGVGRYAPLSAKAGNVQFYDGKVLFTANGVAMDPACCCDIPWSDCFSESCDPDSLPGEITADLGAGGWLNYGTCDACPDISGQYVLAYEESPCACTWVYREFFCTVGGGSRYLHIFAYVAFTGVSPGITWWWVLGVGVCLLSTGCRFNAYNTDQATYHSGVYNEGISCLPSSPLSLNNVGESHDFSYKACIGSLPGTATLTF